MWEYQHNQHKLLPHLVAISFALSGHNLPHEIFTPPFDSIISMIVYMMLLSLSLSRFFPSLEVLSLKAFY